jgi:hypothetical protein
MESTIIADIYVKHILFSSAIVWPEVEHIVQLIVMQNLM